MKPAAPQVPWPLPDPPLADGPLRLRPWAPADAPALVRAWADAEIARWTGVPATPSLVTARHWIAGVADRRARGTSLDLLVDLDGTVAGEVGIVVASGRPAAVEIGWWTAPDRRGQGVARTAARLLTRWVVEELPVDLVMARCAEANPASGAVARGAGYLMAGRAHGSELWTFGTPAPAATIGP